MKFTLTLSDWSVLVAMAGLVLAWRATSDAWIGLLFACLFALLAAMQIMKQAWLAEYGYSRETCALAAFVIVLIPPCAIFCFNEAHLSKGKDVPGDFKYVTGCEWPRDASLVFHGDTTYAADHRYFQPTAPNYGGQWIVVLDVPAESFELLETQLMTDEANWEQGPIPRRMALTHMASALDSNRKLYEKFDELCIESNSTYLKRTPHSNKMIVLDKQRKRVWLSYIP